MAEIHAPHNKNERSLLALLKEAQSQTAYIPHEVMVELARRNCISLGDVYGIATFYNQFRFHPPGKHPVKICMGTTCHIKGGKLILEALERELEIKVGETTPDREFSLDRVACIGCCVMAPVMVIGEDIYPKMKTLKIEEVLVGLKEKARSEEPPSPG